MLKCLITLILIPSLLLSQWAAMAHSHGNSTGEGHATRAHIHLSGMSSTPDHHHLGKHSHGHEHGQVHGHGHRHGHSHSPTTSRTDQDTTHKLATDDSRPPLSHDSDCVFVGDVIAVVCQRTHLLDDSLAAKHLELWSSTGIVADWTLCLHDELTGWPPPLFAVRCPLYLRHLSLRI